MKKLSKIIIILLIINLSLHFFALVYQKIRKEVNKENRIRKEVYTHIFSGYINYKFILGEDKNIVFNEIEKLIKTKINEIKKSPHAFARLMGLCGELNDKRSIPCIMVGINDKNISMRSQSISALSKIDDPQSTKMLISLLKTFSNDDKKYLIKTVIWEKNTRNDLLPFVYELNNLAKYNNSICFKKWADFIVLSTRKNNADITQLIDYYVEIPKESDICNLKFFSKEAIYRIAEKDYHRVIKLLEEKKNVFKKKGALVEIEYLIKTVNAERQIKIIEKVISFIYPIKLILEHFKSRDY